MVEHRCWILFFIWRLCPFFLPCRLCCVPLQRLIFDFLFASSKLVLELGSKDQAGEKTVDQPRPVCSTSQSQTAAFELLVTLCTGCPENLRLLSSLLTKLFYSGKNQAWELVLLLVELASCSWFRDAHFYLSILLDWKLCNYLCDQWMILLFCSHALVFSSWSLYEVQPVSGAPLNWCILHWLSLVNSFCHVAALAHCILMYLCVLLFLSDMTPLSEWEYLPPVGTRPSRGYVGLKNAGATCYMNSVLQSVRVLACYSLCCIASL